MIKDFLASLPKEAIEGSKNIDLQIRSVNAHTAIDAVLSKTVLQGGKRLRPLLTLLMAHLFQVDFKKAIPYARASELVHAASLSHDDVIDNATLRRGAPSINILSSNKKAVLAGDYLLSSVIVDLSLAGNLDLVREMSLVIKALSEGEWLQLDLIDERNISREVIREIAEKKTSSVMSFCALAPAVLAGAQDQIIEQCREFGRHLGLAFQLIDDTLDYSGESLKDQELDLQNGIVNAVVYEMLSSNASLMSRFKNGENLVNVVQETDFSSYIDIISNEAQEHLNFARASLYIIKNSMTEDYKNNLNELDKRVEALELVMAFMAMRQN